MLLLGNLQDHLLLAIVNKIPPVPLCRLRQTCSAMDSFVESQAEKLSSRTKMGIDIYLGISLGYDYGFITTFGTKKHSNHRPFSTLFPPDFKKYFSGVSVKNLEIIFSPEIVPAKGEIELVNILRRLKLTCESLHLPACNFLLEMLDLIDCKGKKEIDFTCADEYLPEGLLEMLEELKNKPNPENFKITSDALDRFDEEVLDLLKPFGEFVLGWNNEKFASVFETLSTSNNYGNLKKIRCVFWDFYTNRFGMPFNTDNVTRLPEYITLFDEGEDPFVDCDWFSPSHIRRIELPTKYAVIVEVQGVDRWNEDIYLVEKDPSKVLQIMTEAMKMKKLDDSSQREYVAASEEQRKTMFQKVFKGAAAVRNFDEETLYD